MAYGFGRTGKEVSCLRSYNALNARESCSFFALRVLQTTDGILQTVQKIRTTCACVVRKTAERCLEEGVNSSEGCDSLAMTVQETITATGWFTGCIPVEPLFLD